MARTHTAAHSRKHPPNAWNAFTNQHYYDPTLDMESPEYHYEPVGPPPYRRPKGKYYRPDNPTDLHTILAFLSHISPIGRNDPAPSGSSRTPWGEVNTPHYSDRSRTIKTAYLPGLPGYLMDKLLPFSPMRKWKEEDGWFTGATSRLGAPEEWRPPWKWKW